ncbi:hypothetical protein L249_8531 [Ophiocordyceps polyrhachis-furcata BCC 54312]|uniref:Heterokaryon incompatibility domain-containing protein n=1 Tax=Ophiocordyceps polyrhachis-furcata BCC 54312 TaxID=1330021 RepID=A0A367L730_9HYPO|nr:hypothetical protein L249_8531 [Ophiocordyceps polyrhachis-furcata BCC 54312]
MSCGWIRVMKLFPGAWNDMIEFELSPPMMAPPSYKVLSYVWGSRNNKRPIYLWDSWTRQRSVVYVTVNLDHALRRIRRADSHLTLWVDAICIDQTNVEERSIQVQFMRDVFAKSEEVVVYLGEPRVMDERLVVSPPSVFHLDDRDFQHMAGFKDRLASGGKGGQDMDVGLDVFCLVRVLADQAADNCWPQLGKDAVYQGNLFEALRQFMQCKWWSRVWTVQEIIVPREVTVYYGGAVAPWHMFVTAARCYRQDCLPLIHEYRCVADDFSERILEVEKRRERWRKLDRSDLLSLLRQFGDRQATEPRDKIYALLGLSDAGSSMIPDYSLPISRVFQNTVLYIIRQSQSLDVFLGDVGRKVDDALPSWVPDWTAVARDELDRLRVENIRYFNAGLGSDTGSKTCQWCETLRNRYTHHAAFMKWLTSVRYRRDMVEEDGLFDWLCTIHTGRVRVLKEDDGVISMPGLYVDTVAVVGDPMLSTDTLWTLLSWAKIVTERFSRREHRPRGQELGHVFGRALCADTITVHNQTRRLNTTDTRALARWLLNTDRGTEKLDINHVLDMSGDIYQAIRVATHKRRLFITSTGYIGLGPTKTQVNHFVYVVPGSKTPFVLRNAGESRGEAGLELVGDCYAHGIMDGEATQQRRLELSWRLQEVAIKAKWTAEAEAESVMSLMADAQVELQDKQPDFEPWRCENLEVQQREIERRLCDAGDSLQAAADSWRKSARWERWLSSGSCQDMTTQGQREELWSSKRSHRRWEKRRLGATLDEVEEDVEDWSPSP